MTLLEATCARIPQLGTHAYKQAELTFRRSLPGEQMLGRLEELGCRVASIYGGPMRGAPSPALRKALVVMVADHGIVEENISSYPQSVTAQMLSALANGTAAVNVMARNAGADIVLVDMGVRDPQPLEQSEGVRFRSESLGSGTGNIVREPAMSQQTARRAVEAGIRIANDCVDDGVTLLGIGEMGIGNSTIASAIAAALLDVSPSVLLSRGTSADDATLRRKQAAIEAALELHKVRGADALTVLAHVGGFEFAGLAGVILGAAARRVPVLLDGFASHVAALVAAKLAPLSKSYILATHAPVEAGEQHILTSLGARPLIDLEVRLGEGVCAALGMNLVEGSLRLLAEMSPLQTNVAEVLAAGYPHRAQFISG